VTGPRFGGASAAAALLAILAAVALLARAPLPVSEARTLSVAWDMWLGSDWLVPRLNGRPYPDKPPLLFWAILIGWKVGGVSETWARLVVPLFGVGCVGLTASLARALWPTSPGVAQGAPILLVGMPLFLVFGTSALFDVPLAFFVLLALCGAVRAIGGSTIGVLVMGIGLGLGALTKGPVVLVHALPVLVLAPLWSSRARASWVRWYAGVAAALVLGAGLAFAWAIPAARAGGAAYAEAILWGQTGGRLSASFAHARPWWFYLPLVPLIVYPWVWWPPLWRVVRANAKALKTDAAIRFCLTWLIVPFLGFCVISGKQPNYLVPLLPALALLGARLLLDAPGPRRIDAVPSSAPLLLLGLAGLAVALDVVTLPAKAGMFDLALDAPLVLLAGILALLVTRWRTPEQGAIQLTGLVALGFLAAHVAFAGDPRTRYDLGPVADFLARAEAEGHPIAHPLGYEGTFQFAGRLTRPLEEVEEPTLQTWAARHAGGFVVSYPRDPDALPEPPAFLRPYRGGWIAVWQAEAVARHPFSALED
jgi:hypothetical protein